MPPKHWKNFRPIVPRLTVTAPVAGVVRYGRVENGAWVDVDNVRRAMRAGGKIVPQAEFITVVADGPLRLRAVVPEDQSQWLKPGLAGRVSPKIGVDHRLPAEVIHIEPVRRPDGAVDVLLGVDVPENLSLRAGMHGQIRFVPYEREKALVVPIKVVRWHAGHEPYVTVHVDDRTQRKSVTLGPRDGDRIEILKGLNEGDVIELDPKED